VFLAAARASPGGSLNTTRPAAVGLGIATVALIPGLLLGWAIENVPIESLGIGGWLHSLALTAAAIIAPIAGGAALACGLPVPTFSGILARSEGRRADWTSFALGWSRLVLCVLAMEIGLGLIFDPRYRDVPFAPLTAAAVPFLVLGLVEPWRRPFHALLPEVMTSVVLAGSAVYVAVHEGFANWQALWLAAVLAGLSLAVLRAPDAPGSRSVEPEPRPRQ
jgi:glucan 1,3-beta-glucosidase